MKLICFILAIVLASSYSFFLTAPKRKLVFLQIIDAAKVSSSTTSFFFESPKCPSKTLKFNLFRPIASSKFTFTSLKHYLSNRQLISLCNRKDSKIVSIKSYWREAGFLPFEDVNQEMKKAYKRKMYTPNLLETQKIAQFLFFKKQVPEKAKKTLIKHQMLGICTACKNSEGFTSYHHYIIDRNANAEFPEVWNSKVRVIYIGTGGNCMKSDMGWAEKKARGLFVHDESFGLSGKKNTMNSLLENIKQYLKDYPIYNALYNCQHFANNLYNKITGKSIKFISQDLMVLKEKGISNEQKLKYNFKR